MTAMNHALVLANESERTDGPAVPIEADGLPQLFGRSRALLRRDFEETDALRLPVGHPTVAFTELQVYGAVSCSTSSMAASSRLMFEKNEISDFSSLDATLLELQKRAKEAKYQSRRGDHLKEEFQCE